MFATAVLPPTTGNLVLTIIAAQLQRDIPELLVVLSGMAAVWLVLQLVKLFMTSGGSVATGGGSVGGGSTRQWRKFERDNERVIRNADRAIADSKRIIRHTEGY